MVPLKYLSNFWRTLEMPLINCEINFPLTVEIKDYYVMINGKKFFDQPVKNDLIT